MIIGYVYWLIYQVLESLFLLWETRLFLCRGRLDPDFPTKRL